MKRVGITGIDGLIGWHLRCYLHSRGVAALRADKPEFASAETLRKFAAGCDVIVHLAGRNRGPDAEVAAANVSITEQLLAACDAAGVKPHIIFSSSTHIYRDTAYGASKRKCAEILRSWADSKGAVFTNLVLPNVFGESGKPFYNSAVSTFCHQLATGGKPEILKDAEIELLHAQAVAERICEIIAKPVNAEIVLQGAKELVSVTLGKLAGMAKAYGGHIVPALHSRHDIALFNTYRSYLFPAQAPVSVELKTDARGYLFEAAKSTGGGQTFISSTEPGITRGNHYHLRKFERFLVIKGKACIRVRKLFSESAHEFVVDGDTPQYVDMPAMHTHNISNIGEEKLITMFWANELLDPAAPDTYPENV